METLCTTLVRKGDCSCLFKLAEFTKETFSSGELIEYVECNSGTLKASAVKWLIGCAFDLPEWKCIGPVVSSILQTWSGL